jgi:hypothetical protein
MKEVKLNPNITVIKCPKCSNNTDFKAHSNQISEDCCNVWVECICGYDPTAEDTDYRFEDVWGGTSWDNVKVALHCWNDAIKDAQEHPNPVKAAPHSHTTPRFEKRGMTLQVHA